MRTWDGASRRQFSSFRDETLYRCHVTVCAGSAVAFVAGRPLGCRMPHDSPSSAAPAVLPASPPQAPGLLEAVLTILGYFILQLGFGMGFKLLSDALARWFPDGV